MTDEDAAAESVKNALGDSRLVGGVVVIVLVVVLLSGLIGFTASEPSLGDGTATVTVVEPTEDTLHITHGRYGTDAVYLRIPDLVANVEEKQGRPRLVYRVVVPQLDVDRQETKLITSTGRLRVPMEDRGFRTVDRAFRHTDPAFDDESRTADGRIVVRVQSFTGDRTILNRSIEVHAP